MRIVSKVTMKVATTFLLCLVMLQYVCHAKPVCANRHPKLCLLHPGKRGYISNDNTGKEANDYDRSQFTQPKWLDDKITNPVQLDNLFGEEDDDFLPFSNDRPDYNQELLSQLGLEHETRNEHVIRILRTLMEENLSYR